MQNEIFVSFLQKLWTNFIQNLHKAFVKGIQVSSNEGQRLHFRGDNSRKIANLNNFSTAEHNFNQSYSDTK